MNLQQLHQIFLQCGQVCTDTRNIIPGSLFVALKGENFDANRFAEQAIKDGCSYAIADDQNLAGRENIICVENSLETLQQLARFHRKQMKARVIAITGTNGKTTTKELISAVLSARYNIIYTQGNLNNHIGVPLTLLRITPATQIAVVEMGANHIGEIAALCKIADPEFGLITNIGQAHLEGFGSPEGIITAKTELYKYLKSKEGLVFVNLDNPLLAEQSKNNKTFGYGIDINHTVHGSGSSVNGLVQLSWGLQGNESENKIQSRLVGEYNTENLLAAVAIGTYFEVPRQKITESIEQYSPSNNRSQIINTEHNTIIMDAYNANPTSMMAALNSFEIQKADRKTIILGDMLELGEYSAQKHKEILERASDIPSVRIITVGQQFMAIASAMNVQCFSTVAELADYLNTSPIQKELILIKGSRGIALEKVLKSL